MCYDQALHNKQQHAQNLKPILGIKADSVRINTSCPRIIRGFIRIVVLFIADFHMKMVRRNEFTQLNVTFQRKFNPSLIRFTAR